MNLEERVINAVRKSVSHRYEVTAESHLLEDLGVDSFDILMILGTMEDEFDISIDPEDFADIKTVSDIIEKMRPVYKE